mmetsp:Transcript_35815/g.102928  ORF Transcript_35815/g.102928 Transcript_35815/m.102928 type:complete len:252 (+) Transcript_35815:1403-2158(+)
MRLNSFFASNFWGGFASSSSSSSASSSLSPSSSSSSSASSSSPPASFFRLACFEDSFMGADFCFCSGCWCCSSRCKLPYNCECTDQSTATPRPQIFVPFSSAIALSASAVSEYCKKPNPRCWPGAAPDFSGKCTSISSPIFSKAFRMCFSRASKAKFRMMRRPAFAVCLLLSSARKPAETSWPSNLLPCKTSSARRAFCSLRNDTRYIAWVAEPESEMLRRTSSMPQPPGRCSSTHVRTEAFEVPPGKPKS